MLKCFAWQLLRNTFINISFFKFKSQNELEKKKAKPSEIERTSFGLAGPTVSER